MPYNYHIVTDDKLVMSGPILTLPMNSSLMNQPIGVLDSGVGGLSVLKHIHTLLPHESLLYVADSKHAPYGNKTPEQIQARCFEITEFLVAHQAKAIVVACNTATAAAIDVLRAKYTTPDFFIPIIGMEPAVKPAAEASKNGIIGVLATVGTLKSAQFAALLESYGRNVKVVTQACVGLVECIERGELETETTLALLEQYCQPLLNEGADTIVLGCTHYPFVRPLIEKIVGSQVALIDTGAAVANQLKHKLLEFNLLRDSISRAALPKISLLTNSESKNAHQIMLSLWGKPVDMSNY